eukprot:922076_1
MQNMKTQNHKLERLIEYQKERNQRIAHLKHQALHLKNTMLFPHVQRRNATSFASATASSHAKKRSVTIKPPPTRAIKAQRQTKPYRARRYVSHYDELKKKRTNRRSQSNTIPNRPTKPTKARSKPMRRTIPKEFHFATTNRIHNRKARVIKQQKAKSQSKTVSKSRERIKKTHLLSSPNKTDVLAARYTRTRSSSHVGIRQTNASSQPIKKMRQSRSQPHFMKSVTKKIRSRSNANKERKVRYDKYGKKQTTSRYFAKQKEAMIAKQKAIARKEFNEMKQRLRSRKKISLSKSRSLEKIQSRYSFGAAKRTRRSVNVPGIEVRMNERKKEMNELLLTPIREMEKDIEDLAIDEILTEDVTAISDDMGRVESIVDGKDDDDVEAVMDTLRVGLNTQSRFTFSEDDDEASTITFVMRDEENGVCLMSVKNVNQDLDAQDDHDMATDSDEMMFHLKEKFEKLDHLFVEIAEKIDAYDSSSSADFAENVHV